MCVGTVLCTTWNVEWLATGCESVCSGVSKLVLRNLCVKGPDVPKACSRLDSGRDLGRRSARTGVWTATPTGLTLRG